MQREQIVSLLQKVKMFLFCSANLTDCSFAAESEEIGFFTAESEDIVSLLQKVKRLFLAAESEEIGFFTAESEEIPFLQCQFNRLFLCSRK